MTAEIEKHGFGRQEPPGALAGTVSAGFAAHLMQFAVARGADPQVLADLSGIALAQLEDADRRIPLPSYAALMQAAKELCRAPSLALHLGAARDFREFSVVGLICYAAPTM